MMRRLRSRGVVVGMQVEVISGLSVLHCVEGWGGIPRWGIVPMRSEERRVGKECRN